MFDVEQLVADCRAARSESQPAVAVKEVLERVVSRPGDVARALPPDRPGIEVVHVSAELTVLKVVWAPGATIYPHDHRMWAAIAMYGGQEDNTFYRRTAEGIVTSGGRQLHTTEVLLLGDDAIHGVTNPRRSYAGAIHVYGGDLLGRARSEWDPVTFEERPYDLDRAMEALRQG